MLTTSAAKTVHRIFGHVITTLDTDLLDCIGHVFDGDAQETLGDFFDCHACANFAGECLELAAHRHNIEGLIRARAKDMGELIRLQFTQ